MMSRSTRAHSSSTKVEPVGTLVRDTKYSGGDACSPNEEPQAPPIEENNNQPFDKLSKEFARMGKMGCVESCLCEDRGDSATKATTESGDGNYTDDSYDDEYLSDEFEEEHSDEDNGTVQTVRVRTDVTHTKSVTDASQCAASEDKRRTASVNGQSSRPRNNNGTWSAPGFRSAAPLHHRRTNMSFSNERLRDIERTNGILLRKILEVRRPGRRGGAGPPAPPRRFVPSAEVQRRKQQQRIDYENLSYWYHSNG